MILAELLDNNNALVRTSLELIEESLKEHDVEAMVKDVVKTQEPHELTKGMFIAVKTLMFAMRETYSFPTLCNFLYSDAEELALKGRDVSTDYKVVNLLVSMEEDGGSFYLQVHSLPNPVQTVTCLIKMFKRLSFLYYQENPDFDALKAIPFFSEELNKYSRDKTQRQKEQDQLIAVMRAEGASVQDALHLMEVLAPHFLIDITEDGERIPHLNEKAFQLHEVKTAINVAHQVELLKGLCLITCVFLSKYLLEAGPSIIPILETRRKEIEAESSELDPDEDELEIQTNAMELLACVAMLDEESFYQQAYAVDDIEGVIISLSTSLYRTSRYVANQDVVTLASDFRNLLK
jgi:hypothetical protein